MSSRHLRFLPALFLTLSACTGGTGEVTIERRGSPTEVASDVEAALSLLPRAEIVVLATDGVPKFIRGDLGDANLRAADAPEGGLGSTLAQIAPVFRIDASSLKLRSRVLDRLGALHLRFRQMQNGLEVVGGDLSVHVDPQGVVYAAHGTARSDLLASPVPSLSGGLAVSWIGDRLAAERLTFGFPRLVYFRTQSAGGEDAGIRLAYEITAAGLEDSGLPIRDRLYVDAHNGELLGRHPQIMTARSRSIYTAHKGYTIPGTRLRTEGQGPTGDAAADAAYTNTGVGYSCFKTLFGRDSYDGSGGTLASTVHYGRAYNNAYWNGSQMVFGDGDGSTFRSLALAMDVTVHELSHGITERSSSLVYQGQSGALNEAMSDILSATCEAWKDGGINSGTFKVGEDIYTPGQSGDALRYMADPTADGQSRDWYPGRYTGSADNGGVHWNSGIPNLAFVLLAQGGSHPRGKSSIAVSGIGIEQAGKIFYRANTLYLTSYATFEDTRAATAQAASDLFGAAATAAVHDAWSAVGVPGAPTTPTPAPAPAPGPTPGATALSSGVPVSAIAGAAGAEQAFTLVVPQGAATLTVQLAGGSGDADLYVRRGAAPTTNTWDYRPYLQGNNETVTVQSPAAATWHIMLRGYSAFSGTELVAIVETAAQAPAPTPAPTPAPGAGTLQNGSTLSSLSAATGTALTYTFVVPAGASGLVVKTSGGTGDADLYLRFGAAPTTSTWDYRPYKNGNNETVNVASPGTGTYHVMLSAYTAFSGLALTASWTEAGAGGGAGGGTGGSGGSGVVSEIEPNDTMSAAQLLAGASSVSGTLGVSTDRDIFRVDASGTLTLGLTVPAGHDYDLELYDLSGAFVARSNKGTGLAEAISVSAGSGTGYYVLVYGYNADFSASAAYTLQAAW